MVGKSMRCYNGSTFNVQRSTIVTSQVGSPFESTSQLTHSADIAVV